MDDKARLISELKCMVSWVDELADKVNDEHLLEEALDDLRNARRLLKELEGDDDD